MDSYRVLVGVLKSQRSYPSYDCWIVDSDGRSYVTKYDVLFDKMLKSIPPTLDSFCRDVISQNVCTYKYWDDIIQIVRVYGLEQDEPTISLMFNVFFLPLIPSSGV